MYIGKPDENNGPELTREELWQRVSKMSSDSPIIDKSQTPKFKIIEADENNMEFTIEYVEPHRLTIDYNSLWREYLLQFPDDFVKMGRRSRPELEMENLFACLSAALDDRLTFDDQDSLRNSAKKLKDDYWREQDDNEENQNNVNHDDNSDDSDNWGEWIDDSGGRTPNDDRSDSMNPNSHRYNPGK